MGTVKLYTRSFGHVNELSHVQQYGVGVHMVINPDKSEVLFVWRPREDLGNGK